MTGLARLGLPTAVAIVIANMIGTGVFTSTGFQAASLHDPATIMIAWVVGGVLALCGATAYAELGAMMPKAGGEYVYLREAYHPVVGAMSGWASLVAGFSAPIAAASLLFAAYLGAVAPALAGVGTQKLVAMGLVAALTALHGFDTVIGGRVQTGFTSIKVLLIVGFIGAGLLVGTGSWDHFASEAGGLRNVFTTDFAISLIYVGFAYSGWNAVAYIAGDVREPVRNVPRALLIGTGTVMALYLLLNLIFFYAVSSAGLATGGDGGGPVVEVGDAAARAMFGSRAGGVWSLLIALALISTVSAMVMAGPRVYAAMAEDHALPAIFGRRSSRGVPVIAVLAQGVMSTVVIWVGEVDSVIRFVGFTLSIFAALAVIAVVILRQTRPHATRPYRTTGYPVTPVIFVGMSGWVAYAQIVAHPWESASVAGVLLVGAAAYLAAGQGQKP